MKEDGPETEYWRRIVSQQLKADSWDKFTDHYLLGHLVDFVLAPSDQYP